MVSKAKQLTGFTLIELLLVLVIISIASSMVMLAVSRLNKSAQIEQVAVRLQEVLIYLQQQAILRGTPFSLQVSQTSCQAYYLQLNQANQHKQWHLQTADICDGNPLPQAVILSLRTSTQVSANFNSIIITPDGQLSDFALAIGSGHNWYYQIQNINNQPRLIRVTENE